MYGYELCGTLIYKSCATNEGKTEGKQVIVCGECPERESCTMDCNLEDKQKRKMEEDKVENESNGGGCC